MSASSVSAPVAPAAAGTRLPVFYIANGQRVPEDLHLPDAPYLIERTFQSLRQGSGPFAYQNDEYRILQGAQQPGTGLS